MVNSLNPLLDPRWSEFLQRHPRASVFHSAAWLEALRRTYAYEPVVFTTAAAGEPLTNGLVFCQVRNWLTGKRMVSLPFSDHCQPLVESAQELAALLSQAESQCKAENWKNLELRPVSSKEFAGNRGHVVISSEFALHQLDLRPGLDQLFSNLHKSCIRRKIQKAERVGLTCEGGRSETLLAKFYQLLVLTRRRHQLPPQPLRWFRNLMACFGEDLTIRVAAKASQPIASIITLRYKNSVVYKYGCSDEQYHNLGAMPFLFWQAIQDAKNASAADFDLGRSDLDNPGLAAFKDHLGAARSNLCYFRIGQHAPARSNAGWKMKFAQGAFAYMPDSVMKIAGNLLYRHVG